VKKLWKIINNVILAAIILFSILVILSYLNVFGTRMFVVKSGSMEPKIHTGSVVIVQSGTDYKVGDVITFKIPNSKDTVTHRIVVIKPDVKKNIFYQVKGDANKTPDPDLVASNMVVGKVSFSIPYLGYLVAFIKTLPGLVIFIIIPATIIIYQELTNIKTEAARIRTAKRKVVEEVEKIEGTIAEEEKKIVKKVTKRKVPAKASGKPSKKSGSRIKTSGKGAKNEK